MSVSHRVRLLVVFAFTAITIAYGGCANRPSSTGGSNAGLPTADEVDMVIYQSAGHGHLPMPATFPLRGLPLKITSSDSVHAIVDALSHPDGRAFTRMARNNRLAVVRKNGQITMFGISNLTDSGCDITFTRSSVRLVSLIRMAPKDTQTECIKVMPPIRTLEFHSTSGLQRMSKDAQPHVEKAWHELLRCYDPLALKGNWRCRESEILDHAKKASVYISVQLAKPGNFSAVVTSKDAQWPPKAYDSSAVMESIGYDSVTAFREESGLVRFVFGDSQRELFLFTDAVNPRKLLSEGKDRHTPPVYGPDLFDQLVALLRQHRS